MDFLDNNQMLLDATTWLATLSIFTFTLSLLFIPWVIGLLPTNCFQKYYTEKTRSIDFTPVYLFLLVLRNIVGVVLLLAGFAMLFLPGQGILTIIISLIFLTFPGKRKLLFMIISRPAVQRSLNWLRSKRSKPPFTWPGSCP